MQTAALPEIQIIPEQESELEPLYRVIIHNDDVTPMNVVVNVLEQIFMLGGPRPGYHVRGTFQGLGLRPDPAAQRGGAAH